MKPRFYQVEAKKNIHDGWLKYAYTLLVMPTGGGKTFTFSDIIKDHNGAACAIAHRQELVSQISLALARDNIRHKIIGPKNVVKLCVSIHMAELNKNYYDPNSLVAVAGVDTLIKRGDELKQWLNSVTLWVMDEAHHVLRNNKWGKAVKMFPNAKGLGVTATPLRTDGKGLGAHADGVFELLIESLTMRELITLGYLTDYRIFAPETKDLDLSTVDISKTTGDYNSNKLKLAIRKSHIIGDIVSHYLRIATGKLGITFTTDIDTAVEVANNYNLSGVPAAVVTAKTSDADRTKILRDFKNRKYLQLVNVDIFGEGFDLPAIEVVSMARPTQSYSLYVQQFGRACRIMDGKSHAIIIDHVGNVLRHGLPDAFKTWTLDHREKRSGNNTLDATPLKTCLNPECLAVYERIHPQCPYCGYKPKPSSRSTLEHVDGDLMELDVETLNKMRGDIEFINRSPEIIGQEMINKYSSKIAILSAVKYQRDSIEIRNAMQESIKWYAGILKENGYNDNNIYRHFYIKFGIDMLSAQGLKRKESLALATKINQELIRL